MTKQLMLPTITMQPRQANKQFVGKNIWIYRKAICMFNSKEQLKTLSRALTHLVYRNTDVEDFHSYNFIMNEDFYKKVATIVGEKLKSVMRYYNRLMAISIDDVKRTLQGQKTDIDKGFWDFLEELAFNCACGTNWDDPVQLDELPQADLVSYILNGRFLQCCMEHRALDDDTMCSINKDINNRIYTLLLNGYFDGKS